MLNPGYLISGQTSDGDSSGQTYSSVRITGVGVHHCSVVRPGVRHRLLCLVSAVWTMSCQTAAKLQSLMLQSETVTVTHCSSTGHCSGHRAGGHTGRTTAFPARTQINSENISDSNFVTRERERERGCDSSEHGRMKMLIVDGVNTFQLS